MADDKNPGGLALFQHRLLQLLWENGNPAEIRQALLDDPSLAEFHSYVRGMDERMIEVAAELVHKWGRS